MTAAAGKPISRTLPDGLIALGVGVVVAVSILTATRGKLSATLGDTDDAMRLVMVRDLARGHAGWFHPHIDRLQPPDGLDMHWSRLVDAGLLGLDRLFGLVMAPAQAEGAMRLVWPLLWIFPAVWALIAIARRLGGRAAVAPAAALLIANLLLYVQWWPGRIDHHNVQITLTLFALLGAVAGGVRGALFAGAATGLCLAVGLESLPFLALAGASFALRFLFAPRDEAQPAQAYATTLLGVASLAYLAQTNPARLAASACDALAANLWAALAVAACGLVAAVLATRNRGFVVRLLALGLAGVAAGAVYLALDPACLYGPLGGVDPRLKPIWLDHIREMQPLLGKFWVRRSDFVVATLLLAALGHGAFVWLGRTRAGRSPTWWLLGACLVAALALALGAERGAHYVNWFALPLIAAALGDLSERYGKGGLVLPLVAVAAFSQPVLIGLLDIAPGWSRPDRTARIDACLEGPNMRRLARLPPGLVLSEIDMGPRILARTPHSAVAAPYHRMSRGILAAHRALAAPAAQDEREVRALGVDYVAACPAHRVLSDHAAMGPASLQQRLDRGEVPAWLEPLSAAGEPLQVYRVRPR